MVASGRVRWGGKWEIKDIQTPQTQHGHNTKLRPPIQLQLRNHKQRDNTQRKIHGARNSAIRVGTIGSEIATQTLPLWVPKSVVLFPEIVHRPTLKDELQEDITGADYAAGYDAPDYDADSALGRDAQEEYAHRELEEHAGHEVEEFGEPPPLSAVRLRTRMGKNRETN